MTTAEPHPHRFSPDVVDAIVAFGLTAIAVVDLIGRPLLFRHGGGGGGRLNPPPFAAPFVPHNSPTALSFLLVVFALAPLAVRRRYPLLILGTATLAAAGYQLVPANPPSIAFVAPLIAIYTVGAECSRKVLLVAGAITAAILIAASLPSGLTQSFWPDIVRTVAMVGVAGAIGDATRTQRAYLAETEQRAIQAERTRDEEARRRVDEERLRIARELHDVVAHSLSIIAVQSGAAAHVIDSDPAEARRSLEAIRAVSKEALDELRAMLGVLRAEGESDAPLSPVPGLGRVDELIAPVRAAGFDVNVTTQGDLAEVPTVVEVSAYRVLQEALTNVVRHAGRCTVWISVTRTGESLDVSVADDGKGPTGAYAASGAPGPTGAQPSGVPLGPGHGIAGMRERVLALGGDFEAGARAGGGFRVHARLPLSTRGSRA